MDKYLAEAKLHLARKELLRKLQDAAEHHKRVIILKGRRFLLIKLLRMKKEDRIKVWEKYEHHCAYCGREIKFEDMQVDHFVPKNRGGNSRWSDKEGTYVVSHGEDSIGELYALLPCL